MTKNDPEKDQKKTRSKAQGKAGKGSKSAASMAVRRNAVREIGELLPEAGGVAFRRFGFSRGVLLARWSEIVGPVYARWSVPESLRPSRRKSEGGTLTVRVEGAFALQLQHIAPQLIERINRILGPNSVEKLKLVQGTVTPPGPPARTQPAAPARPNLQTITITQLEGIADSGLRSALEALAEQVAAGQPPPKVH